LDKEDFIKIKDKFNFPINPAFSFNSS
jgi:hypothetical protein